MIKGVIFDFDGVIVDTMNLHYRAWQVVANSLGFKLDESIKHKFKGASRYKSLKAVLDHINIDVNNAKKEQLSLLKDKAYQEERKRLDKSFILENLEANLKALKSYDFKLAIGSASRNAKIIIQQLKLEDYFDVMLDANDIHETKPDPKIFTECAQLLKLDPVECIVVEDSIIGVQAANIANFKTISIGNSNEGFDSDFHIENWKDFSIVDYIWKINKNE